MLFSGLKRFCLFLFIEKILLLLEDLLLELYFVGKLDGSWLNLFLVFGVFLLIDLVIFDFKRG